jgi:hypothetical protein
MNDQQQEPTLPASESHAARLTRLRTTGFRKLRAGRIHVRCYVCGRKMSNMAREEHDPATAVLIETPCERCPVGKEPETFYYDAAGVEVEEWGAFDAADDGECCGNPNGCTLNCWMHPEAGELVVDPSRSTP